MSFYGVPYHKAIKRNCGRNSYDNNHECLQQVNIPILKHFLAKKQIQIPSDCLIFEAHA